MFCGIKKGKQNLHEIENSMKLPFNKKKKKILLHEFRTVERWWIMHIWIILWIIQYFTVFKFGDSKLGIVFFLYMIFLTKWENRINPRKSRTETCNYTDVVRKEGQVCNFIWFRVTIVGKKHVFKTLNKRVSDTDWMLPTGDILKQTNSNVDFILFFFVKRHDKQR